MKKFNIFAIFAIIYFSFFTLPLYAQMNSYCSIPPFLSSGVSPNVLILQDVSGSMWWSAYNPDSQGQGYCDDDGNLNCPNQYNSNQTYEGYFVPQDVYSYDTSNNFWYINNSATPLSCPSSIYANNFPYTINGNRNRGNQSIIWNSYTGNCLNFLLMSRSDLIKWSMSGGDPQSCAMQGQQGTHSSIQCDPTLTSTTTADGYTGIVLYPSVNSYYGLNSMFSVLTPISRINQALLPTLTNSATAYQPRIGLLMFTTPLNSNGKPYTIPQTVYIGGYPYNQQTQNNYGITPSSSILTTNPYTYIMRFMNYQMPVQGTPTGPALQDVIDYFSQTTPTYSYGFSPGLGTWKDPLYVCNGTGCQAAPCAQNYVILLSDGGWDIPNCTTSSDPIKQAYNLHVGGANGITRSDFSNITISDIYAIYLGNLGTQNYSWPSGYGTVYGQNALENIAYFGNGNPTASQLNSIESQSCTDMTDCNGSAQGSLCGPPPSIPSTFFAPSDASQIAGDLSSALSAILKQSSSGSSVGNVNQQTQQGSTVIQAIFYPQKNFDNNTQANWVGYLYDWWLYSPVGSQTANILDANTQNDLEPSSDYVLNFVYQNNQLQAQEYLNNNLVNTVSIDQLSPLWEAGSILWSENPSNRTIYTDDGTALIPFNTTNAQSIENYLNLNANDTYLCDGSSSCTTDQMATNLVNYIIGNDMSGARNRTVTIGSATNVWKLGDIIYSTPQAVQYTNWLDPTQSFNVVYVGANDGMLHAFLAGQVQNINLPQSAVAELCANDSPGCPSNVDGFVPGSELWAFIPQNSLPYLKYLANPNYCHIYYQDLTPYIFRANGHIILIGGMRLGGATNVSGGPSLPISGSNIGYSAYYALDITNPFNPIFLWEFTNPNLGFTYSGPAVINVNGQYFIMFLTGPTDYNGDAGLPLNAFILSLNSDFTLSKTTTLAVDSSLNSAFGGRLFTEGIDDSSGNTFAVPFGVSIQTGNTANNTWSGAVYMLMTNDSTNPSSWTFQKIMTTNNPITAKIAHMSCFGETYLYFGTGKYFFKTDNYNPSQPDDLYGVNITNCLNGGNCNINAPNSSNSACQELTGSSGNGLNSWYIALDDSNTNGYLKERDISDPTVTGQNVIFFTTTEPTSNLCGFGGQTRVWGLNCATGQAALDTTCPGYTVSNVSGSLFLQTSTGAVTQINPNTTFTQGHPTSAWQTGISPESSSTFVAPFTGKAGIIIQWKEN